MVKRKICVFTGTRAEYGLLKPLMEEIQKDKELELQLLVSGTHLACDFGLTYKEIEKDGFKINEKLDIALDGDTPVLLGRSVGLGVEGCARAYKKLQPDILVILGDRFEAFAAATAAMLSIMPIAHISGGEATFGLIDEAIRHSITKMSHLHFTSIEEYRKRVVQLGENPKRVFNVGSLGVHNVKKMKLLSKDELERSINIKFNKHNLLVTFHPITLEQGTTKKYFKSLLQALNTQRHTNIIFTKANADAGGRVINSMIDKYAAKHPGTSAVFNSMGQLRYLSTMQFVDAVVGNSSSGIIEAPSFRIGTINIGDRQKGRIGAGSIINCDPSKKSITAAIRLLYSSSFREKLKKTHNIYENKDTPKKIKNILKCYNTKNIIKKQFFDLEFSSFTKNKSLR